MASVAAVSPMPTDSRFSPSAAAANQAAGHVVLVVTDSESTTKRIESYLRNAGHPVRTAWVNDIEDVEEALRRGAPDLLLCADNLKAAPLRDVIDLCKRLAADLPVVLLSPTFIAEDTVSAMAAGARDHVAYDDLRQLRHLELVSLREFSVHRHLRELRSTQKRLEIFESRHQELISGTNDAVAHIQEGILSDANPAFAHLLGHDDAKPLIGMPLMDLVGAEFAPKVKEQIKLLLRGKTDKRALDCCLVHKDGQAVAISARLTVTEVEGEQLIEMLIRAEAAQAAPAKTAEPSGRLQFFERLGAAIAGANQQKQQRAALLLSVDAYPALEERLGLHDAEQAVLQLLDWAQSRLTPNDQIFRFSTHELAVLATFKDGGNVQSWGEAIVDDARKQIFNTAGHEAQLSLTATAYPFSGSEQASAIVAELTSTARQLSARGGKQFANLGATAETSLQEREDQRRAEMVRKAIADNRLKLAYQSIASLEGDSRQHFDVLLRMIDEEGHEQHASEFIRAAEKGGLMCDIDRWVTARALKMQAKRDGAQQASSLFVKLSEDTLKDSENFVAWLQEKLKTRPLRQGEIVFEVQERVLQNHIRKAKLLTKNLTELGAQVAIEHFGVGSNSAQMLEHIPTQFVKFHQSFAKDFGIKETQKHMAALMEIAKQRSIKVIVSHIEDANVMARLWQMGVNFIQGYHVQEPEVVLLSAEVGAR